MFKEGLLSLLPTGVLGLFLFYLLSKGTDFGTGLLKTWKNKNSYKSRIMRDGIIRWIAYSISICYGARYFIRIKFFNKLCNIRIIYI